MLLKYTAADDDLKFLFYYYNRNIKFQKDVSLSCDAVEDFDAIIKKLYELAKEEFSPKSLAEFKKLRMTPVKSKNISEITVLSLLNYINIIKQSLISGSLKNKEYIDNYTAILKQTMDFDPDFYFLDIRAGYIESIEEAEGMDSLYCEKVKANKDYFICSGLRGKCSKDDLLGKTFLFLLNLKKAKFKSFESEGMICCTEGDRLEPLKVEATQGSKAQLDSTISLFNDVEYGKIDLSKSTYKAIFEQLKIIDHHLTFKTVKLRCDDKLIITDTETGDVR